VTFAHDRKRAKRNRGEGRATPGPPRYVPPLKAALPLAAGVWLVLALCATAAFVLQTAVVPHASTAQLVTAVTVGALLFLGVFGGMPRAGDLTSLGARDGAFVACAGVLGAAAAPALVVANRASDVPPGAVVAFWTMAIWGALFLLIGAVASRMPVYAAAALLGVAGAMGVLGNWERPSSFSLLVRYPDREVAMLLAGVLFVGASYTLARLAQKHGQRGVYLPAAISGVVAAVAVGTFAGAGGLTGLAPSPAVASYGAAGGLMFALAVHVTRTVGTRFTGTAFLVGPPLITALLFVEEATGVFGPRPVLLEAAGWSTLVIGAAVVAAFIPVPGTATHAPVWAHMRASLARNALALIAAVFAIAGLVAPGVAVTVTGRTGEGAAFNAEFVLEGFRTTGGWLALAIAILLAATLARPLGRRGRAAAAVAGVCAAAVYFSVRFTPIQTWIPWIPPELQHDYGTEYANIVFAPVEVTLQVAAVAVACVTLVAHAAWKSRRPEPDAER